MKKGLAILLSIMISGCAGTPQQAGPDCYHLDVPEPNLPFIAGDAGGVAGAALFAVQAAVVVAGMTHDVKTSATLCGVTDGELMAELAGRAYMHKGRAIAETPEGLVAEIEPVIFGETCGLARYFHGNEVRRLEMCGDGSTLASISSDIAPGDFEHMRARYVREYTASRSRPERGTDVPDTRRGICAEQNDDDRVMSMRSRANCR